jgi:outer membrane protein OmpA-like peptidoglycan-associated protein
MSSLTPTNRSASLALASCRRRQQQKGINLIKPILAAAAVLAALPVAANAQEINAQPGFYIGAGGGLTVPLSSGNGTGGNVGWVAGGKIGYDFVGPRIDLDVGYSQVPLNFNLPGTALDGKAGQLTALVNLSYDFFPTSTITPYIGAGAGIAFIDSNSSLGSTQFAWDALLGVRYNVDNALTFGVEARYVGTTNPTVNFNGQTLSGQNQNITFLAGVAYKFNQPQPAPPPPPPPPAAAPSFMVFFDWDRSNLSQQALNTIKQAAGAYKTKGSARITATGHTDTSGPENYNMALSLRRANTVKDALVRDGVPATAIAVVGRGEAGLLVQTADGVREPQNRRVEIVIQ